MVKNLIRIVLVILFFTPIYSQDWQDYLNNDWQSAKAEIGLKSLMVAGGWVSGMYLLSYGDEYLNENVKPAYKGNYKYYFDFVDGFGHGPIAFSATAGVAGISLLTDDSKFRQAALTSFESIISASLIVYTIKIALGRNRPDQDNGPRIFEPFSGWDDSFPSGHTCNAFAMVTPWVYYYERPWTYLLYIIPASTAMSRMIFDRHWFTDVLTGGAIGYMVGYYLTKWHKEYSKSHKLKEMPAMINFSIPL